MKAQEWNGICSRSDCERTNPAIAFGQRWGLCFTHEMLDRFFQYEMYGEEDAWHEPEQFHTKYEAWLQQLITDGVDLDLFAEEYANWPPEEAK